MGDSANILLESMTLAILGGLVAMLAVVLAMENWLLAWEQRAPSPLVRLLWRVAVPSRRIHSPDVALAQKSCPECRAVGRCHAWIDSGRTDASYRDFCPNAELVERLAERRRP